MNEQIRDNIDNLLEEYDLPYDAMGRATRFLRIGELSKLYELPLPPEEMIEAGHVLLQAPSGMNGATNGTATKRPVPVLSEPVRRRLHHLFKEDGESAEAALYILTQDLKARAFNRTVFEPA